MNFKMIFVPSDATVIRNNINDKLLWFDYCGVKEIQYGDMDVIGVDEI